ncbi:MAG TPA: alpha-ketoacid dehydrogenase subunit beta, partial [Clostridia bacterium]|nr:alpha-ketoacid dehydrogenase subunit beta [Clostridia bacterium]
MREISYLEAIREALIEEMERDERVFLLGEDIGKLGGPFGVTKGLIDRFGPERVLETPISETGFVGCAVGAASMGMRPVAEVMYSDFIPVCMDQIVNQAAKMKYMFGGKIKMPLTIRTMTGAGLRAAAHHSQSIEAVFCHFPGLKVVAPSTPADAKGLLKSAIRDDNAVLFFEHKMLYGTSGLVPEGEYTIPLGK